MAKKWCIVVRPADTASSAQIQSIGAAFTQHASRLDWRREGTDWLIHVDALDDRAVGEPAVSALLGECGLTSAVVSPFPIGRWYENLRRYVISGDDAHALPSEPAVPADEITWGVFVRPASAFDWQPIRAELARRGRVRLDETDDAVEVGACDEADAQQLIADLLTLPTVAGADASRLGRWRRWRVRQQLLGNYEGVRDPSQQWVDWSSTI
jgi:hypothetical protein